MELLAGGRDADVFLLDGDRELRRCRDGRSAAAQASTIRAFADTGFPTPRVHSTDGPEMVLDRVDGPDLQTAVLTGAVCVAKAARVLADLHRRLHALPWPGGSLLHLDLHPLNVLWTPGGPVVVDWTNARAGEPDPDVAMTALILAQVVVAPEAFTGEVPLDPAATSDQCPGPVGRSSRLSPGPCRRRTPTATRPPTCGGST